MMHFDVKFRFIDQKIPVTFKHYQEGKMGVEIDPYSGPFEATPTDKAQVFQTSGKLMGNNFVVNPIPKEYGLVTYDQDRTVTIT